MLLRLIILIFLLNAGHGSSDKQVSPAVYAGTSPCDAFVRQLIGIPDNAACEKIKWQLSLFGYAGQGVSKTFKLTCQFGMQEQNAPGFVGGGQSLALEGTWIQGKGVATDADAIVYQLHPSGKVASIFLVRMDDNILHFLYRDKNLLIGNAGYGYTLNRINN
jgi:hypothetical protein